MPLIAVIVCVLFPPALIVVIPWYLIRGSRASRCTAAATERMADVIAPQQHLSPMANVACWVVAAVGLYVLVQLGYLQ